MPVLEDAAQAAGSTRRDGSAGLARHGGDVLVLPLQEPRLLRRRRHHHDRAMRRSPSACADAPLPRLARQGQLRAGRLQLAPGRAAGGDPARAAAPPRRLRRRPRAAAARHYEEAGLGELVELPVAARRVRAGVASVRDRPSRGGPPGSARCAPRGSAARPTTARPFTASDRCAQWAQAASLPGTEQAARDHLAIPMSPVLTREQADRGRRCGTRLELTWAGGTLRAV